MPATQRSSDSVAAEQVIAHVRRLIEDGSLKPGDRLAPERLLARQVGVSRPSVRAGLRSLAAMGVVQTRQGAGTFITDGPPTLASEPLSLLAALHGLRVGVMFEARRVLEAGTASLAAERASAEQMAAMAEEVTGMYAALADPQEFLVHDLRFHRAVALGADNPVLSALIEMASSLFYEQRRSTIEKARNLREAADMHRKIYQAVRSRDSAGARLAMEEHLLQSQAAQALEDEAADGGKAARTLPPAPSGRAPS